MNIEDVKVGMKVVFTEDFRFWKAGDITMIEQFDCLGCYFVDGYAQVKWFRHATPEDIAPQLWQSYKSILNNEALAALEQVIMGEHTEDLEFTDCSCIMGAFYWSATPQGFDFWEAVSDGAYDKREEPMVTKFDYSNTKINIKKYADESGITLEQAIEDYGQLVGKSLCSGIDSDEVVYLYSKNADSERFLGWDNSDGEEYFNSCSRKEITLTRNVTITPSFVIPATVTLPDDRTVLKKDYDEALSKLKTFTGN